VLRIESESDVDIDIKLDMLSEHKDDIVDEMKKCLMMFWVL
jgi:hypothetical protein